MEKYQLYKALDIMEAKLGTKATLEAIAMALDVDTLESVMAFITRMHDLNNDKLKALKER